MIRLEQIAVNKLAKEFVLQQRESYLVFMDTLPHCMRDWVSSVISQHVQEEMLLLSANDFCRHCTVCARRQHNRIDFLICSTGGFLLLICFVIFIYLCLVMAEEKAKRIRMLPF